MKAKIIIGVLILAVGYGVMITKAKKSAIPAQKVELSAPEQMATTAAKTEVDVPAAQETKAPDLKPQEVQKIELLSDDDFKLKKADCKLM